MMDSTEHGFPDKRFPFVVHENFHCPICYYVLRDPVQCRRNEHYFCTPCITRHLQISPSCPVCQDGLTVKSLREPSRIVADFLSVLKISCEFAQRGCRELIELRALEQHVKNCDFMPVYCSNEGCTKGMNRRDKKQHENEMCKYRKLKCSRCGKRVQYKKYEAHGCVLKGIIEDLKSDCEDTKEKMAKMKDEMKKMEERQKSQEKTIKNMAMMISTLSNTIKELTTQAQNGGEQEDELRGSIIIAGGHDGSSYLNSTEMFDFATKTWQILSSMKESRLAPSTFLYQNNVIVAGGFNGDCSTDRMEGMNTTRDPKVWRDFPARLPLKCNRHQIVAYQNRLIITGGESSDENQISDAIYEISITPPHTSKVTCRMPNPLVGHAAQLHDDSILIIGGRTSNRFKDATNTVLSYDVNKRKCRELVPLPVEVSQMAVVRHGGNLVIIGGQDKDGNVLDAVIVYNIETGRYRSLPNMKAKRAACSAVLLGNQIVVMGGRDDKKNYLSSVECLSLERQEWVKLPEMNVPRMYGSALVIPED